jgi:hypothetical protein
VNATTFTVANLLEMPFARRNFVEKQSVIRNGSPCPSLPGLILDHKDEGKDVFVCHFSVSQYDKVSWLTGSNRVVIGEGNIGDGVLGDGVLAKTVWKNGSR